MRLPAPASRYNDMFVPRKLEFKGLVTDYTRSSFQGNTLNEVILFTVDLQKMVPNEFHHYIDWNQTRTKQGTWQTKTIVNMWFKNETILATMIGLLKVVEDELKKVPYKFHGQEVSLQKIGNESSRGTFGEGTCPVCQRPQSSGWK